MPTTFNEAVRRILVTRFDDLCRRRDGYSIRAYARLLHISHSTLSLVLSGKRQASKHLAKKMLSHLALETQERQCLNNFLVTPRRQDNSSRVKITRQKFEFIATWIHYALLSLIRLNDCEHKADVFALRLGVHKDVIEKALKDLIQAEFIEEGARHYKRLTPPITVENTKPIAAGVDLNQQFLEKAAAAMHETAFEERDISNITFPMSQDAIIYAKKRIHLFRRKLIADLEAFGPPDSVYVMLMQFFPITTKR